MRWGAITSVDFAAACLLTAVGGFLDAYTYIVHDKVFANAQTGNVVLLGIHLSAGEWIQGARHLPPVLAFLIGAALTRALLLRSPKPGGHAIALCLSLEAVGLILVGTAGGWLPDTPATITLSMLASIQSASFGKVHNWSYNSAMTTGNLRDMAGAVSAAVFGREGPRNRFGATVLGLICLSFFIGATSGSVAAREFGERAVLLDALALLGVIALIVRKPDGAVSS